jgi:colicin import membrane protein
MARKLKVFETSQGFFDLNESCARSVGCEQQSLSPRGPKGIRRRRVIAAAMAKPGIVLRRPVGSDGFFREHADLPSAASLDAQPREGKSKPKKSAPAKPAERDEKSEREAAAKYAKEERQREKQRAKAEAEAARARKSETPRLKNTSCAAPGRSGA